MLYFACFCGLAMCVYFLAHRAYGSGLLMGVVSGFVIVITREVERATGKNGDEFACISDGLIETGCLLFVFLATVICFVSRWLFGKVAGWWRSREEANRSRS